MKPESLTVAIDPNASPEEQEVQIGLNAAAIAKLVQARKPKPPRWFSWKPKGLEHTARIGYRPHEEPHAVWVHVQIQAGGRTYEAQFPFQREQLRTMRQKADDFMVAEFRKSLARDMAVKPPVTKA